MNNWKLQTIDSVKHAKQTIMSRLNGIQKCIQEGRGHGGLLRLEKKLQVEMAKLLRHEELMWFQRSRAKWLVDGDRNTRYYHLKTVQRRKRNKIVMLRDGNGQWLEKIEDVKALVNKFYFDLFTTDTETSSWFQTNISFPQLEVE